MDLAFLAAAGCVLLALAAHHWDARARDRQVREELYRLRRDLDAWAERGGWGGGEDDDGGADISPFGRR